MKKIVINRQYGGFSISKKALKLYNSLSENKIDEDWEYGGRAIERDDPLLVQVVEELGEKADGAFAALEIVEIPDDVEWQIEEYDGLEWVAEKHRTWP